jgi:hypothetical protein
MNTEDVIENRIEKSGLVNLDLEGLLKKTQVSEIDLADFLFERIMLREKDFREKLAGFSWDQWVGHYVMIYCSEEAIVPQWAWMLLSSYLIKAQAIPVYCDGKADLNAVWQCVIRDLKVEEFENKRVLVHGCADRPMPNALFVLVAERLQPVVKSLMFGEACSNVPVFKKV